MEQREQAAKSVADATPSETETPIAAAEEPQPLVETSPAVEQEPVVETVPPVQAPPDIDEEPIASEDSNDDSTFDEIFGKDVAEQKTKKRMNLSAKEKKRADRIEAERELHEQRKVKAAKGKATKEKPTKEKPPRQVKEKVPKEKPPKPVKEKKVREKPPRQVSQKSRRTGDSLSLGFLLLAFGAIGVCLSGGYFLSDAMFNLLLVLGG